MPLPQAFVPFIIVPQWKKLKPLWERRPASIAPTCCSYNHFRHQLHGNRGKMPLPQVFAPFTYVPIGGCQATLWERRPASMDHYIISLGIRVHHAPLFELSHDLFTLADDGVDIFLYCGNGIDHAGCQ